MQIAQGLKEYGTNNHSIFCSYITSTATGLCTLWGFIASSASLLSCCACLLLFHLWRHTLYDSPHHCKETKTKTHKDKDMQVIVEIHIIL